MDLDVAILSLRDERWLSFVAGNGQATAFHDPSWAETLTETYGYDSFVAAALDGGEILAGAPVSDVRGAFRRQRWAVLPYTDCCPPLLAAGVSASDFAHGVLVLAARARVDQVEIRSPVPDASWQTAAVGLGHTLPLDADVERVFSTFSKSRVRRNIARSEREGVRIRHGTTRDDLVTVYYGLHERTRRRQGVPVQPKRFFDVLWRRMIEPGLGFVLLAETDGRPVAGAVFLASGRTVTYKFGASDADAWPSRPNHAIFAEAVRWGCEQGFGVLDFGRTDSTNEGLRAFKQGWGTTETVLEYATFGGTPSGARGLPKMATVVLRHSPAFVGRALGAAFYRFAA